MKLSVDVRLAIWYPFIGLVPLDAPLQVSVIISSLYAAGDATAVVADLGAVFLRTELVDTFHPE
ncbi:hypothetical protein [Mobilitalea sibirica]|uniref:hypothetical protein n=1 Tax=Mobilitalea sibirica TaxID=1462919 RepID=UPI001FB1111E|nr:hypothetical protein [Mobilitalea sibirica]